VARIKFDVKGVAPAQDTSTPIPKGMYKCTVETCLVAKPEGKDQRIEVVYVIADGDHKGRKLFDYLNLESEQPFAQSRVRQFLEAFGIVTAKKEAGTFDPEKLVGEDCNVRVAHQTGQAGTQWEGQIQSRVGGVFALGEDEAEDEDLDEDEESEDEDEGDEDEDDEDEVDLDELDRAELKKLIKDEELGIKVTKSMSDDDVRKAIAEAMGGDEDEDEGEDDEDDEEDVDYNDLDLDALKATCKERGLSVKGSKKILVARLEKDDESSDDGDPF